MSQRLEYRLRDLAGLVMDDGRGSKAAVMTLWSGLHAVANPDRPDYAARLGEVFAAVREAAGASSLEYLGPVLRSFTPAKRAEVLRAAAELIEQRAASGPTGIL